MWQLVTDDFQMFFIVNVIIIFFFKLELVLMQIIFFSLTWFAMFNLDIV